MPLAPLPAINPLDAWSHPAQIGLRATWLGHSTVLLEMDSWRVLTDPVWGPRASPSHFIGPKRFQPVPVAVRDLPPLDAVIVSGQGPDRSGLQAVTSLPRPRLLRHRRGRHRLTLFKVPSCPTVQSGGGGRSLGGVISNRCWPMVRSTLRSVSTHSGRA